MRFTMQGTRTVYPRRQVSVVVFILLDVEIG